MIKSTILAVLTIALTGGVATRNTARSAQKIDNDVLAQFDSKDWEKVGITSASVCSGDYAIGGYSCVTHDLNTLNFSTATTPILYDSSRVLTMSDDVESKETFIYVYKTNKNRIYDKVSLATDPSSFDTLRTSSENIAAFSNYSLSLTSISADGNFAKYKINDLNYDYKQEERHYIVRELIDWANRDKTSGILASGINYGVRNAEDGKIECVQTALNLYNAKQMVADTYFAVANVSHNYVRQQNTLLFSLYKNDELFTNTLRAIEVQCSSYQFFGTTTLHDGLNASRGKHFVKQAIGYNWQSGARGMNEKDFHILNKRENETLIIEPKSSEISYKPSMWHWWNTRKYTWSTLGKTSELAQANGGFVKDSWAEEFTYYAILRDSGMYLNHSSSTDTFTIEKQTGVVTPEGLYQNIPSYFYDVSLARFWYEEGTKVRQGVVLSAFNDSFGAVRLVNAKAQNMPSWLKTVLIASGVILGLMLISILTSVLKGAKGLGKILLTAIKLPFTIIKWIFTPLKKYTGDHVLAKFNFTPKVLYSSLPKIFAPFYWIVGGLWLCLYTPYYFIKCLCIIPIKAVKGLKTRHLKKKSDKENKKRGIR